MYVHVGVFLSFTLGQWSGHLGVEAGVLIGVADVDGQTSGRHQLGDAVVDEPIRVGGPLHAVFETGGAGGKDKQEILHRVQYSILHQHRAQVNYKEFISEANCTTKKLCFNDYKSVSFHLKRHSSKMGI